ncbi:NAD(P)-binding protein [Aspergillus tetrazonus]
MSQTVIRIAGERNSVRNLKASREEIPKPSKYGVLIKVHAVSLNYRDIAVATSQYPFPVKDNVIPCSDAAGVVVEVCEGVKGIVKCDHVVGTFDPTNTFGQQEDWLNGQGGPVDGVLREYLTLPGIAAVKLPKNSPLSFSEWSTLVCTGTGGVSITGLLLARAAGATTIVTSSSDEKLESVKAKFEWSKEVLRLTDGEGVDYVLENGGSGTIAESINAVKMGGNVSVIGFLSQAKEMPDVAGLALAKGAVVRGITVGSTQLLQEVVRFVGRKGLRLPVDKEFGFSAEETVKTLEYLKSGSVSARSASRLPTRITTVR